MTGHRRSGLSNASVIASLTLKRLVRGRAVWISALIAALPLAFAALARARSHANVAQDILAFVSLLIAVLPPMFVASSIGEDIEDRTATYLWSRPIPRWAVLAGKLLALVPVTATLITGSWFFALYIATDAAPTAMSCIAVATGTLVTCLVCAGIATLVPRSGMPLSIAYMLFFDIPIGLMPISLSQLSVTYQMRGLSDLRWDGLEQHSGGAGLIVLGALWLAIALWRVRRLEA